jgi:outer membrane receptor protein involved in Fe transport
MLITKRFPLPVSVLSAAVVSMLATGMHSANAAPDSSQSRTSNDGELLEEVVVTGSLIPQVRVETATPVTVISAEQIQSRGFSDIAEALQRTSFSTGSVQGGQYTGGFTQSAKTLSMFGLAPSYVKYLIDGRPMIDYPALYNGTDIIGDISGVPTILVDHIDVLPGAQSSIYGSDAVAGVVNIVMKKKLDGPIADVRYGWSKDGGGMSKRFGLADGFEFGQFNLLAGIEYEKTDPIWGYQRDLTRQYYANGTSAQTAERDYLVFGYFGPSGDGSDAYYFSDPNNCANVAGLFNGSVHLSTRPARGRYCGTTNAGYYTIANGKESTQGYLHLTNDVNDNVQLFADVLMNHQVARFAVSAGFFGTEGDSSSPFSYFYDPNLDDLINVQRVFSPEEAGGLDRFMNKNTDNAVRATLGATGSLGESAWKYTVDMTYAQNQLTEQQHMLFTSAINDFFAPIYGADLPINDPDVAELTSHSFTPDYAAFYNPLTPAQYASFSGNVVSHSRTQDSMLRGQLTNTSLFKLPGGNAGIAVVLEGGHQGWDYQPDPRYLTGETYLYTAVAGTGDRSRYAATTELRLPVLSMLTVSASGRYDDYKVSGDNVDKATYNLGLEFRPLETLLLRGRYGTAFKAPTLSDQFQGKSGYFEDLTDYYYCNSNGYTGSSLGDCPQAEASTAGSTSGNTKLKPISSKAWDFGVVWAPLQQLTLTADYIHWNISDEIIQQNSDQLLRTESLCRLGTNDINSPTCVAALAQVTRGSNNELISIYTPKINVSRENLNVLTLGFKYLLEAGVVGKFEFDGSYSDILKHELEQYLGDPVIDELTDATYSTDFKTKVNASVTWTKDKFSTTLYGERYGKTPNYLATIYGYGTDGAAKLNAWVLFNLSASYEVIPSMVLSLSADNLLNEGPPEDRSYPGIESQPYNELNYNVYGRSYYAQLSYKFGK